MADYPVWVLVPIFAIIAWAVVTVNTTRARQRTSSSELANRVDELERRVASIEKGA